MGDFFSIDWEIGGSLITLGTLTLIFGLLCFYYSRTIRKQQTFILMPRLCVLIFIFVQWVKANTFQILGKSYRIAVPFFIYIMTLFWFSNIISILGFPNIGTSLVVPATLAIVVFFGTIISGLVHRGYRFFGDYVVWIKIRKKRIFPIVDPLKLVGEASKLLSLTFRLWGNTLAGSLILFALYTASQNLFKHQTINFLGPLLLPLFVFPLHIYFDVIDGTIQPLIFMLLTMCYWSLARHGEGSKDKEYHLATDRHE